jgi:putative redox protein
VDAVATTSAHLSVTVERAADGTLTATNSRGGQIALGVGDGASTSFTPTELLLVAIGGCTAVDVDLVTSRRAEPERFEVGIEADKIRDENGNRLTGIEVTFRIAFPPGEAGDKARAVLPDIVRQSHDRLCTVSRTVETATPISTRIE